MNGAPRGSAIGAWLARYRMQGRRIGRTSVLIPFPHDAASLVTPFCLVQDCRC